MNQYVTLHELREYLGHPNDTVKDNQLLTRVCIEASRLMDIPQRRRHFYPEYATYKWDYLQAHDALLLDRDLLEVSTLTTRNGAVTITSSNYFLMNGLSSTRSPYSVIALNRDQACWEYDATRRQAHAITGVWGYHDDWNNAWGNSGDSVQDNPLLASATSLTVSDADSTDERGFAPRFQIGQLVRFGTSLTAEYARITNVVENALTIQRGVNGSTAAEQVNDTEVYIYRPQYDIFMATLAIAVHLYRRKDSIGSLDDRPLASPSGVVIMPNTLPGEAMAVRSRYTPELP